MNTPFSVYAKMLAGVNVPDLEESPSAQFEGFSENAYTTKRMNVSEHASHIMVDVHRI